MAINKVLDRRKLRDSEFISCLDLYVGSYNNKKLTCTWSRRYLYMKGRLISVCTIHFHELTSNLKTLDSQLSFPYSVEELVQDVAIFREFYQ